MKQKEQYQEYIIHVSKKRKYIYVSYNDNTVSYYEKIRELFDEFTDKIDPPLPKYGGVLEERCTITLPISKCFCGLSYKGYLEGWYQQITQGATAMGLLTAKIQPDKLFC